VARMGEERKVYRILMGKPEGKRSLGRPRRRWENGIRIDLREIGWGSVDWIQLAQDRDRLRAPVNTVINLRVLAPRSLLSYTICISDGSPAGPGALPSKAYVFGTVAGIVGSNPARGMAVCLCVLCYVVLCT
jgi:hypothetical protein